MSTLSNQARRTKLIDLANIALWLASIADIAPVQDESHGKIIPFFPLRELHQVFLDFHRVFVFAESQPS